MQHNFISFVDVATKLSSCRLTPNSVWGYFVLACSVYIEQLFRAHSYTEVIFVQI